MVGILILLCGRPWRACNNAVEEGVCNTEMVSNTIEHETEMVSNTIEHKLNRGQMPHEKHSLLQRSTVKRP